MSLAHLLVRIASLIVPADRRDEWYAEWVGEIAAIERGASRPQSALRFALGSVAHAVTERAENWRADVIAHDVRQAVRHQRKHLGQAIAMATLVALGVGANTTVFTLVNAVLFRAPAGIRDAAALVQIGRSPLDRPGFDEFSYPAFIDLTARSAPIATLAAFGERQVIVARADEALSVDAQMVSGNYFAVLRAGVQLGRPLAASDDALGAPNVVVISDGFWRGALGADPSVLGGPLLIGRQSFTVVGIAAAEFTGAAVGSARPQLWLPLHASDVAAPGGFAPFTSPRASWLDVIGRPVGSMTTTALERALRAEYRTSQIDRDGEASDDLRVVRGLGLKPADRARAIAISGILMAMVGAVLLIACANVAAVLLARAASRESELSVRLALGAPRGRLVRQLVIETVVIAVAGSIGAFVATIWTAHFVAWIMPYPLSVPLSPDVRVLAFALAVGVITMILFGIGPSLRATNVDPMDVLRGSTGAVGPSRMRGRTSLLVAQVALSFVLLAAVGLLLGVVRRDSTSNPGFETRNVFAALLNVQARDSVGVLEVARRRERVVSSVAAIRGVEGVALASLVPASGSSMTRQMWRADDAMGALHAITSMVVSVDTAYLHTLRIALLRGRAFSTSDDAHGRAVAIVNETLARQMWAGENAVGRMIAYETLAGEQQLTIVGVARDTRNRSARSPIAPQLYVPLSQGGAGRVFLHVRLGSSDGSLLASIRAAAHDAVPEAAPLALQSLRTWMSSSYADLRLVGILGGVFAALALALASAGIYGLLSYEAARRRREYGVHLALGASPASVRGLVIRRAVIPCASGVAIGVVAYSALIPAIGRLTGGALPFDPWSLLLAVAVLASSGGLAALIPALVAGRSDPMRCLRAD